MENLELKAKLKTQTLQISQINSKVDRPINMNIQVNQTQSQCSNEAPSSCTTCLNKDKEISRLRVANDDLKQQLENLKHALLDSKKKKKEETKNELVVQALRERVS